MIVPVISSGGSSSSSVVAVVVVVVVATAAAVVVVVVVAAAAARCLNNRDSTLWGSVSVQRSRGTCDDLRVWPLGFYDL